ncbi:MAG: hypothetical protein A3C44_00805 [Gammaproteobacteria bacterium RIFCSPHIGHO2_02_FULL_39_13]|nr:MAG: hypothetical protein A3C44_00805 [Gammaproteobacteria bacterium RIFCSPHIGHO2_02_FULL_39_13]OGT48476.1 MAG: hypothetical protein A3E53_03740 [Gammaproteobacteria bacterium RIFCSPHIGHO2_12_FULL_39_24]
MKAEYNLKKLKIKRRGMLPALRAKKADHAKVRITISLDKDVIEHFKSESNAKGALPYQTQINQALRQMIDQPHSGSDNVTEIKSTLLHDKTFINEVAKRVNRGHSK